jgi:multidrug transporter EmrE-like cation transporter
MKFAVALVAYAITSAAALALLSGSLHGRHIAGVRDALSVLGDARLLVGGGLYVMSFLCWLFVLSQRSVSTAYPLAIGCSYTAILLTSVLFLGDRLSGVKVLGLVLIAAGALCVTTSMSS